MRALAVVLAAEQVGETVQLLQEVLDVRPEVGDGKICEPTAKDVTDGHHAGGQPHDRGRRGLVVPVDRHIVEAGALLELCAAAGSDGDRCVIAGPQETMGVVDVVGQREHPLVRLQVVEDQAAFGPGHGAEVERGDVRRVRCVVQGGARPRDCLRRPSSAGPRVPRSPRPSPRALLSTSTMSSGRRPGWLLTSSVSCLRSAAVALLPSAWMRTVRFGPAKDRVIIASVGNRRVIVRSRRRANSSF